MSWPGRVWRWERKPRPVTIHALEVLEQTGVDTSSSAGGLLQGRTYVRTLCHDLGQKLGCGGAMCSPARTWAAGFGLESAVSLEELAQAAERGEAESLLRPVDSYFSTYPPLTVDARREKAARNGAAFRSRSGRNLHGSMGRRETFCCWAGCRMAV